MGKAGAPSGLGPLDRATQSSDDPSAPFKAGSAAANAGLENAVRDASPCDRQGHRLKPVAVGAVRARAGFIVGPTAAGKSSIALRIAERLGAEIVNADSRQVYRR